MSTFSAFAWHRRSYAGFLIHLGFGCMAIGIAGSSLGSHETDLSMTRGQTVEWEGRTIRYADLLQRDLRQKVVVAAQLEVNEPAGTSYTLQPAQVLYRPQNQWGTKVAIHSTFGGDFYVIMHGGSEARKIHLTLIDHPLIRWLWVGGWIGLVGVVIAFWPQRQRRESDEGRPLAHAVIPRPHLREALDRTSPQTSTAAQRTMTDPRIAIEVRRVTKRFGRRLVLDEIDLEVAAGESIVLTGSNGAGKTTLLRAMAALIRPSSGEVLWFGEKTGGQHANRRLIGMVAHENRLYPHLTLRENLVFAARMCDVARPQNRAESLLETVGLLAHGDRTPPVLSKGMRQRLSLARALIHDPPILLLDEPFEGLDADAERWLTGLLQELRQQGRTLCFVLHDEAKTRQLADRVLHLHQGRLLQVAAGQEAVDHAA